MAAHFWLDDSDRLIYKVDRTQGVAHRPNIPALALRFDGVLSVFAQWRLARLGLLPSCGIQHPSQPINGAPESLVAKVCINLIGDPG